MKMLRMELLKSKRSGVIATLLAIGVLGAVYFIVRKDALLNLPLAPIDILLTQLYGMILILNMFGIIITTCMIYAIEFNGSSIKRMYLLPVSVSKIYAAKFIIITVVFLFTLVLQNLALVKIGVTDLPADTFELVPLIQFAMYSFITSMPVVSFMLLVSSRLENMWMTIGIGVIGFLSGMALANSSLHLFMMNPFVVMLKPAIAMSAEPNTTVIIIAILETVLFFVAGLWMAKYRKYE